MTLAALTYYVTQDDLEKVLSAVGVALRADDDGDGELSTAEEDFVTFARGDATETVNAYCFGRYTPEWLATSNWVNVRATWLAAYALSGRRGDPPPDAVVARCERIEKDLERIQQGSLLIPNLPLRTLMAPAYSNVRTDPRYQFRVIRVERNTSTTRQTGLRRQPDYRSDFLFEF